MLTVTERTSITAPPAQTDHGNQSPTVGRPALTPLERLRQLIEAAPAAVIVTSPDGAILAANGEAAALVGIEERSTLLGSALADRVAEEDRARFREFTDQVCAGRPGALEYRFADPGGSVRWVETRAVPLARDSGARNVFLSVTWDIAERKRTADSELRQARTRVELLEAQLGAQQEAYETALQGARAAGDRLKARRRTLGAAIRRARVRFQSQFAAARLQHEQAAAQAEAERESLIAKLRDAEDRQMEQAAENERLVAALNETRMQLSNANEERNEERAQRRALFDQRERWRVKLSEVLEAMSQNPAPPRAGESQWEF